MFTSLGMTFDNFELFVSFNSPLCAVVFVFDWVCMNIADNQSKLPPPQHPTYPSPLTRFGTASVQHAIRNTISITIKSNSSPRIVSFKSKEQALRLQFRTFQSCFLVTLIIMSYRSRVDFSNLVCL